VNQP
jgi:hypothetical protein